MLTKIRLINEYTKKVSKYEADIAEILGRLKKMGFVFITEEPPKRTSPVIVDPPLQEPTPTETTTDVPPMTTASEGTGELQEDPKTP